MEFTGDGFFSFDNEEKLNETLQHLLRTEPDQHATNEFTGENIFFLTRDMDKEEYITFPEELDDRKEFEDTYLNFFKEVDFNKLAAGRFEWKDDEELVFTDEMIHKVFEMMKSIEERTGLVVLAVGHLDQLENYVHVHFLIYNFEEVEEGTA